MNFNFYASEISAVPVDGIWSVRFAAPAQGTYFLIRRDVDNLAQERELNVHYIEFCEPSAACLGGVEKVQVLRDAVRFQLTSGGAERIGLCEIVISFSLSKADLGSISTVLAHIVEHGRVEFL